MRFNFLKGRKSKNLVDPPTPAADGTDTKTTFKDYVGDAPVSRREDDRFGRWPFSERVASTIAARSDPSSIVIAIYGRWGDGKTTVLNFIRGALKPWTNIVCIDFNPWRFDSETALLQGFFQALASVLDRSLIYRRERIGKLLRDYGSLLTLVSGSMATIAKERGSAAADVSLEELKKRIEGILREENRRVVIFMDDIDRLNKEEIQAIFRLIKLTADFENTTYMLSFDEEMVASAVGEKYSAGKTSSSYEAGVNFLEKIIQVPLHLPPCRPEALRAYCFEAIDSAIRSASIDLQQADANSFVRHFTDGLEIRLTTPRLAKRYGNALLFSLQITKGEVYPVDLMLIEGMRVFYPRLYDAVRHNHDFVLRKGPDREPFKEGEVASFIEKNTPGITEKERKAATSLLEVLFPRMNGAIYGSNFEEQWAARQRICSEDYFFRYFTYSIDVDDVSDLTIRKFVDSIVENADINELLSNLGDIASPKNATRVISKLRINEKTYSPLVSTALARTVARLGDLFPDPEGFFRVSSPFSQAAILVSQLIRNLRTDKDKAELANKLMIEAEPISFAAEIMRWTLGSESEKTLSQEDDKAMKSVLARRVEKYFAALPSSIWIFDPKHAPFLIAILNDFSHQSVAKYISLAIQENPRSAISLIKSYLPSAWSMVSGLPVEADFQRETYDSLARIVDMSTIAEVLESVYGAKLQNPQYRPEVQIDRDEKLANQFIYIHRHVQKEKSQASTDQGKSQESKQ